MSYSAENMSADVAQGAPMHNPHLGPGSATADQTSIVSGGKLGGKGGARGKGKGKGKRGGAGGKTGGKAGRRNAMSRAARA